MGVKGHLPDRLEVNSSSAVFRLFLWMWLVCECVFGAAASFHVFRAKRKIFLKSWISKAKIKSDQRVSFLFFFFPHGGWTSTTADLSSFVALSSGQWWNELKWISNLMHETPKVRSSSTVWDVGSSRRHGSPLGLASKTEQDKTCKISM